MQFYGPLVDRVDITHTDNATLFDVREKRDLTALGLWDRGFGPTN